MGKRARRPAKADGHEVISAEAYEQAIARADKEATYVLRLFVTGMTPQSQRAVENVRKLCETHLAGRYELEIVDIYQQPELARGEQIIAAPTLIKKLPLPLRKVLGDMSDPGRVLVAMGMRVISDDEKAAKRGGEKPEAGSVK